MLKDWFPSGTKFHIEISDFCVYFPSCDKRASHTLAYYTELHQTVPASAPKFVLGWLYNAFLHMFDKIIYYKRTCVRLYTYIYTYIYASIFCQVMKKSDTTKSNMFFFFTLRILLKYFYTFYLDPFWLYLLQKMCLCHFLLMDIFMKNEIKTKCATYCCKVCTKIISETVFKAVKGSIALFVLLS